MSAISPKWAKLSRFFLGLPDGRHCHWCEHSMFNGDGEVRCGNAKSIATDGERIRSWDGAACAAKCGEFRLAAHYTSDEKFEETFKEAADA